MPVSLGVMPSPFPGTDKKNFIEFAKMAEDLGYDSIWVAEAWGRDAFTLLSEIAVHTKRIKLGTCIVNIFSRSAAVLAMTAATLDELSQGRLILGLGTSGNKVIEELHGIPYQKPLTRLREYVAIIRTLLRGEKLSHNGDLFKVSKFKLMFTPMRADIPIYIASLTPKSLEQTGEIADGWIPTYWPVSKLKEGLAPLEAGAARAGKKLSALSVAPMVTLVCMDDVETAKMFARYPIAFYIGGMGKFYYEMVSRMGYPKEADVIRNLWQTNKRDEAQAAVTDGMLAEMAVCGTVEQCREGLRRWKEAGVTLPIIPIPTMDYNQMKKTMEGLAA